MDRSRPRRMLLPKWLSPSRCRPVRRSIRLNVERFEDRVVPATYTVTNTASSGTGSLAAAISAANSNPGADTIAFSNTTSGGATNFYDGSSHTIALSSALPTISDSVSIDGPPLLTGGGPR